ncbi:MAG: HpsJ family protein [Verrucomicrobiota bacterium]
MSGEMHEQQPSGDGKRGKWRRTIDLEERDPYLSLFSLLPVAGIGLLLSALVKYASAIFPPNLTNASWELQTLYAIGETSVLAFLGMALVFSFRAGPMAIWKLLILQRLSWLCLPIAIAHLALVPLGIINTVRIYQTLDTGFAQAAVVHDREWSINQRFIEDSRNWDRLQTIAFRAGIGNIYRTREETHPDESLADRKAWLVSTVKTEFDKRIDQVALNHRGESVALLKRSLRTNAMLILDGLLFVLLWFKTDWIRHLYKSRGEMGPHSEAGK